VTDRVDLREFIAGFIAESDELVAAANASLLEIEAGNLAGSSRPRAVRDLFRTLHTIKGLAGMIGVEPIVELAHALETLVRTADRAGGVLAREAVDASLRGVAAIAERVRAVAGQQAPALVPPALMDAIAAAGGASGVSERPPSGPAWDDRLAPGDRQQLAAGRRAGRRAWMVSFVPSAARSSRSCRGPPPGRRRASRSICSSRAMPRPTTSRTPPPSPWTSWSSWPIQVGRARRVVGDRSCARAPMRSTRWRTAPGSSAGRSSASSWRGSTSCRISSRS
jgi:HPt (histidine-containing phosphotransfer) domain-containing protein